MKRDRIIYILLALCALIGFASGWNYEKIIQENVYECAAGCFELGLFAFFSGKTAAKYVAGCVLSGLKNLCIFCVGCISWLAFPITVFNLFALSFKFGLVFHVSAEFMKLKGVLSTAVMGLFSFFTMAAGILLTKRIADFRIYHTHKKSLDTSDIVFFRSVLLCFLLFLIWFILTLLLLSLFKSDLYGFFNTFL